ncbi:MAG: DNA mismatch repair endonuclease MutL [Lachnospiraceae bacterium]|nr:DNA mismatch repair endonuclease MutL [Lachnospiraceae bacterium]
MKINILDNQTIDKIAAGEVVERPSSIVKELVENAIDSGANAITVEIKDGGISFIRVTDNGCGIEKSQIRNAFLRHATSKISSADDLTDLVSLGFRGEALASIAAVSMVEAISKVKEELMGVRYSIEGGIEKELEDVGAPDGTTFIVRNLFYNTPPRKKFLKQPQTEGSYIADLMEHLAISHPDISFHFIINNQNKFNTSGSNDLKEIIYRIYGKDIVNELIEVQTEGEGFRIDGFLGKPIINRSNRNYELFYINGRYIKSNLLNKAVEDGYKEYLMQHKFPFCVLHFTIDTKRIDVNVHPSKMEVRISNGQEFYEALRGIIFNFLHNQEMIPNVSLTSKKDSSKEAGDSARRENKSAAKHRTPEPFEVRRIEQEKATNAINGTINEKAGNTIHDIESEKAGKTAYRTENERLNKPTHIAVNENTNKVIYETEDKKSATNQLNSPISYNAGNNQPQIEQKPTGQEPTNQSLSKIDQSAPKPEQPLSKTEQLTLFDDKLLSAKARESYEIIGQLFETYWLISYQDKLLIIDQHAAHEKVKYERFIKQFTTNNIVSQSMNPPVIITLNGREKACLTQNMPHFEALGFTIEEFGGNDYAISSVPMDLYGLGEAELFYEFMDELSDEVVGATPDSIRMKIATMACKAAVKGNTRISRQEAEALIDELLSLENPYNCPHGRPTIISMSKYELEKKFKRIVT